MKPITLHPVSILAGLALAGVLTVLSGAAQSPGSAHQVPIHDVRLVGEIPADWWTYVELHTALDGTFIQTYTVPPNSHFVVTKCTSGPSQPLVVFADGQDMAAPLSGTGNGTRVPLAPGAQLTAGPVGYAYTVHLWGYLEPVR